MQRIQRGGAAVLALIGIVVFLVFGVITYMSYANKGNRYEQDIDAKYKDNENVYAQGTQAIMEIAQVPAMYVGDLTKVVTADIQGRYGPNGSSATMQWIKERGLSLDTKMYERIQQTILAFRGKFEDAQRGLLDQCRSYKTALGNMPGSAMYSFAGYPKFNLKEHCEIVTTDKARQTFETKRDSGITLRPAP